MGLCFPVSLAFANQLVAKKILRDSIMPQGKPVHFFLFMVHCRLLTAHGFTVNFLSDLESPVAAVTLFAAV